MRPLRMTRQINVHLDERAEGQIDEIGEKYGLSCAAVIRQAIARWYHAEFPQKSKKKSGATPANGA